MYVIFPAIDVVDESYLSLVAQENENPPPTGLRASPNPSLPAPAPRAPSPLIPRPPPTFHDTRPEQAAAEQEIARQNAALDAQVPVIPRLTQLQPPADRRDRPDSLYTPKADLALPDLVPAAKLKNATRYQKQKPYSGQYFEPLVMTTLPPSGQAAADKPPPAPHLEIRRPVVPIRDLIHPNLREPLKSQQQVTFRLVKAVSDFTHSLSKLHEQQAEDLHTLVEEFRHKNADLRNERPACTNSLFNTWECLLNETESDAQVHTDIAGVLGRAVSRPLLEKTFHMKIQSRSVFIHRESFETILDKTEQMLLKCHDDYCIAFDYHSQHNNVESAMALTEAHNNYVQQLHAANGMVDQYYKDTLPQLLQELDDVYTNVSSVVAETLIQAADVSALKSVETSRRYEKLGSLVKAISATQDLNAFVKTLNIPESMTVSKHVFAPPNPADPATLEMAPPLRDEIIVDRATQNSARNRFDILNKESDELDAQSRQLGEAYETMIRIQTRSLDSQLFNKANELQEDISLKRFDHRVALLHLAAIRAQKEMFAAKVDGVSGNGTGPPVIGGSYNSGPNPAANREPPGVSLEPPGGVRERKLSSGSGGANTVGMKSKWVKAFKSIKGGKEEPDRMSKNGNGEGTPPVIENAHIFQEYTYKKITPCDICSQILRGHTRQGLKCKLCRMNVHRECQELAPKCQPKSRLLRRQKSASEIDSRIVDAEDDSHRYSVEQELGGYPTNQQSPGDRRERFAAMKSLSTESQRSSQSSGSQTQRPIFLNAAGRPVGGSYATKFGQGPNAPKLSEVARMLMAAKEAGELPQASKKDLELQETIRLANLEKAQLAQQAQNGQLKNGQPVKNGQPARPK